MVVNLFYTCSFAKEHYNINIDGEYDVQTDVFDDILSNTDIDCLWIDVQAQSCRY